VEGLGRRWVLFEKSERREGPSGVNTYILLVDGINPHEMA